MQALLGDSALKERHDVWMLQIGNQVDFTLEATTRRLVRVLIEDLDRHAPVRRDLDRLVHRALATP